MTEYGGGTPTQARSHYSQATELNQPDQIFTGHWAAGAGAGAWTPLNPCEIVNDGRGVSGPHARGHTEHSGCVCCFSKFCHVLEVATRQKRREEMEHVLHKKYSVCI